MKGCPKTPKTETCEFMDLKIDICVFYIAETLDQDEEWLTHHQDQGMALSEELKKEGCKMAARL